MHAVKGETGWHFSDPVEITKWFKEAVKTNGTQLKRTVRYFKAWADFNAKNGKLHEG
jgi:ribosomal protein L10